MLSPVALSRVREQWSRAKALLAAGVVVCALATTCAARPVSRAPRIDAPTAPAHTVHLEVPGFLPAVVSVPGDTSFRQPVLVATHGAGGRAEEQCVLWRDLIGPHGFVLCPRGSRIAPTISEPEDGYFYRTHLALEREVMAALQSLSERFSGCVDPGPVVYAGFSQGAAMGALLTQMHPDRFHRLVLIEGGYADWDVAGAMRFGAAGEKRVLFVCGIAHCQKRANLSVDFLRRGGVEARAAYAPGGGHTYVGDVQQQVRGALRWLLEGDARWQR